MPTLRLASCTRKFHSSPCIKPWSRNHDDDAWSQGRYLLRHASEDQSRKASVASSANHDCIGLLSSNRLDDHLRRITPSNLHTDIRDTEALCSLLGLPQNLVREFFKRIGGISLCARKLPHLVAGNISANGQDGQFTCRSPGKLCRYLSRVTGSRRTICSKKYALFGSNRHQMAMFTFPRHLEKPRKPTTAARTAGDRSLESGLLDRGQSRSRSMPIPDPFPGTSECAGNPRPRR